MLDFIWFTIYNFSLIYRYNAVVKLRVKLVALETVAMSRSATSGNRSRHAPNQLAHKHMQPCRLYSSTKSNFILYKFVSVHIYNSYDSILLLISDW